MRKLTLSIHEAMFEELELKRWEERVFHSDRCQLIKKLLFIILCFLFSFHPHQNEYTDWERPPRNPLSARDATLEFLSDGHTAAPLVRLGYMHSLRGGRTYFLHFRHQSGERDFPQVCLPLSCVPFS